MTFESISGVTCQSNPCDNIEPTCQTARAMDEHDEADRGELVIPAALLSPRALIGLVEEFITREGTDYGVREHTFDEKRADVMRLISAGEVLILFDAETESTTLRRK